MTEPTTMHGRVVPTMHGGEQRGVPPCPECGGEVVVRSGGTQNCTSCSWWWLPPTARPLITSSRLRFCSVAPGPP